LCGAEHLTVYNEQDGSLLWWAGGFNPEKTGFWPHIATPVVVGDIAVVPVGRDDRNSGRLHGIRLGGSGDVSSTHRVWDRTDTGIFVATPAVHKGLVYLLRHRGQVVCLNPADGKTVWTGAFPEHRSPYYASPVIANGILYAAREDGVVFAARVEDRFEILSENPLAERIIATPVPASNRLFFRGDHHLFCVQATEKQP
jgi:outer membrane protein assembly factor BamB